MEQISHAVSLHTPHCTNVKYYDIGFDNWGQTQKDQHTTTGGQVFAPFRGLQCLNPLAEGAVCSSWILNAQDFIGNKQGSSKAGRLEHSKVCSLPAERDEEQRFIGNCSGLL
eukprot:4001113-Amphidinium_carterae.1